MRRFVQTARKRLEADRPRFAATIREVQLPSLPAVSARLIAEINRPEPDMDRIAEAISAAPQTAVKVIQTVNSSIFSLRNPVLSVRHALALLGLRHVRPIALSFAMLDALPRPRGPVFDDELFWTDSVLRALFGHSIARRLCPGEEETAFTAGLLADAAIPVLLSVWEQSYTPELAAWAGRAESLTELERAAFGWDHGQAGAWVLDHWALPAQLSATVGLHNLPRQEIHAAELGTSPVLPVVLAAQVPSVGRTEPERARQCVAALMTELGAPPEAIVHLIAEVRGRFGEMCTSFGLRSPRADAMLDDLLGAASLAEDAA